MTKKNIIEKIKEHLSNLEIEISTYETFCRKKVPKKGKIYFCEDTKWTYFNVEWFLKNDWYKIIEILDPYGSATLLHPNGERFAIYNTYGDEDADRHHRKKRKYHHLFTPCVLWDDWTIEIADIRLNPHSKEFVIQNYLKKKFPKKLDFLTFKDLSGKRAFYYYPEEKKISFRINEAKYQDIPEQYKHKEVEKWISKPRIMI